MSAQELWVVGLFHVFHCRCLQLFNLTVSPISPPQTHTNTHAACEFSCWKKNQRIWVTATAATGGFPPQRSEPPAFLAPGCRAISQNPADGAVSINCHYCMQEKFTAAVRKEDRACKKKKGLAGILYEFSSTDLTTGVLPVHLKKLHFWNYYFFFFKPCYCHSTSFQIWCKTVLWVCPFWFHRGRQQW